MSSAKDLPTGFDLAEANAWAKELFNESDRGAVLIGCAYLERLVEDLLSARMIAGDSVRRLLKNPGPLSTFSSQTDLAYVLGWIGPQMFADLSAIRVMRNDFAHGLRQGKKKQTVLIVSFKSPSIRDRCNNLRARKFFNTPGSKAQFEIKDAKSQFMFAVLCLVLQLSKLVREANRPGPGADPPVNAGE
jgi:mannitol operon repressor